MMENEFEELIERGLGQLYSAALFMSGGVEPRAEDRVVEALAEAASHWLTPSEAGGLSWLEERVVLLCVERERQGRASRSGPAAASVGALDPAALPNVSRDRFYRAAAELPPPARAAVWLVMFRRRPYADVAALLNISRDELRDMLTYRETLISVLLSDWRDARGGEAQEA